MDHQEEPTSLGDMAAKAIALPEIVRHIMTEANKGELPGLRLVCKAWSAIATPLMFADITAGRHRLHLLQSSPHIGLIRHFTISDWAEMQCTEFVLGGTLLERMPLLTSFTWTGMPMAVEVVNLLHRHCPRLKSLHILYPAVPGVDLSGYIEHFHISPWYAKVRGQYNHPNLVQFDGLEELTVRNIYEDLPWWIDQISATLCKNAPTLRLLDLSLSDLICYPQGDYVNEAYTQYTGFLHALCQHYAEHGGSPLHIKYLAFGDGVHLYPDTPLAKLLDMRSLVEVDIHNNSCYDPESMAMMANKFWPKGVPELNILRENCKKVFGTDVCPNLKHMVIQSQLCKRDGKWVVSS